MVRSAITDSGEADFVVGVEEVERAFIGVGLRGRFAGGLHLGIPGDAAQEAGRFAVRIFLQVTGTTVFHDEIAIDATELEREGIEHGIGAGAEINGVLGGDAVKFRPGGITLFLEARDEDLLELQPLAFRHDLGARGEVIEHVLDGLHIRDGVIVLRHRGGGMHMGIDEAGENHLAVEIDELGAGLAEGEDVIVIPHGDDLALFDGDGFRDGEFGIHRHDFAAVENDVRHVALGESNATCQQAKKHTEPEERFGHAS